MAPRVLAVGWRNVNSAGCSKKTEKQEEAFKKTKLPTTKQLHRRLAGVRMKVVDGSKVTLKRNARIERY